MENINNYSINEVAKMMGMTLKIVRRYVASGELKTTKNNNTYSIRRRFQRFQKVYQGGRRCQTCTGNCRFVQAEC